MVVWQQTAPSSEQSHTSSLVCQQRDKPLYGPLLLVQPCLLKRSGVPPALLLLPPPLLNHGQVVAEVVAADDITEVDRLAEYQARPVGQQARDAAASGPGAAPPAPVMASRDSSSQLGGAAAARNALTVSPTRLLLDGGRACPLDSWKGCVCMGEGCFLCTGRVITSFTA